MAIKRTKSGKIDKRYLTKAEREELKNREEIEEAQADKEHGYHKEEGEVKPLYTHPEPGVSILNPDRATPVEPNPDPDMSEARKQDGKVYQRRADEPAGSDEFSPVPESTVE
jgi:hypothetical protein